MQRMKWDYELLNKLSEASGKSQEYLKREIKYLIIKLDIKTKEEMK